MAFHNQMLYVCLFHYSVLGSPGWRPHTSQGEILQLDIPQGLQPPPMGIGSVLCESLLFLLVPTWILL